MTFGHASYVRAPLARYALVALVSVLCCLALHELSILAVDNHRWWLAAGLTGGALGFALRHYVHVRLGYLRVDGSDGARLARLVRLDRSLTLAWMGLCLLAWLAADDGLGWQWSVVLALATLGLWLFVCLNAGATEQLRVACGLARGTDVICRCQPVAGTLAGAARLARALGVSRAGAIVGPVRLPAGLVLFGLTGLLINVASVAGYSAAVLERPPTQEPPPSVRPATSVPPAPQGPPAGAARPRPTYAELCPGAVRPGVPAPRPQSALVYNLIFGGPGQDGFGGEVAGCLQPARAVAGHPEVWTAEGRCGGALSSLAVAAPGRPAALLLQRAAQFARDLAERGMLLGASARTAIGSGDFYIVDSTWGSYVLIRAQLARSSSAASGSCGQGDENVRYTVVPPAALDAWLQVAKEGWVWPEPDQNALTSGRALRLTSQGAAVASIACSRDDRCVTRYEDRTLPSSPGRRVTVEELLAIGP